ncbi:unnamed protein product [Orchesella dallaii]|uniref:C2H2-type domain-containing protein n=1 Tax=Orchesella dallaii TaxID=48710 RepID=A0ABP1QU83_9HEXA
MTMEINDEESCQNGSMHPDIPFEFGSGRSGHVVPKQESECVEEAGEDEACYEEFNFAEFNSDDIYSIPDEDPLSMDVGSHVDMRQEVTTEWDSSNMAVIPSDDGIEEIETTVHENESQLEASNIKVKIEFFGNPVDDSSREVATDSSGHGSNVANNQRKVKLKTWLCSVCNRGFPTEKLFFIHVKALHADKFPHSCRYCGKRFAKLTERKKHETIHDPNRFKGEPQFACDFCDKKYHLKVSLEGHRKIAHLGYMKPKKRIPSLLKQHHSRGIRKPEPEVKVEKVLYPCTECDLKFDYKFKLQRHMRCHTGETPFKCELCHQPFKHAGSLRGHIKTVHNSSTSAPHLSRPKFMANQPCPCNICGKVFKIPSQLARHMTMHTGERKYECDVCGQRFRIPHGLKLHRVRHTMKETNQKRFKCRYCGRNYMAFSELNNHRHKRHRNIPIPDNREIEKPFGCGICGKPFYLQEQAMVCAILAHDPTTLYNAMFKHKCPECPEERFGFHNLLTLRKHWQDEHPHQSLPVELRRGMYQEVKDTLPSVTIDKKKSRDIRENGTNVKEYPLVVEFDLLDAGDKPQRNTRCTKKRVPSKPTSCECTVCGLQILCKNLARHMRSFHSTSNGHKRSLPVCGICNQRFRKMKTLRQHEKNCRRSEPGVPKRRPGRPMGTIKFKKEIKEYLHIDSLVSADELAHKKATPEEFPTYVQHETVNVNDTASIRAVLGGKTLRIILSRTGEEESHQEISSLDTERKRDIAKLKVVNIHDAASIRSILGNKELRIIL